MSKFRRLLTVTAAVLGLALFTGQQALAMNTFTQAKRELPKIYKQLDDATTVYCGCPVRVNGNRWRLNLKDCGYQVRKQATRARRVEIEHIMPAWEFGHQLKCWQKGGRKNCSSSDKKFNQMEGDLHNLFPAVGEVNGDRSNFRFTDWNGKPTQYGKCDMVIDFKAKRAQPPKRARGIIARAYLYMADRYKIRLASQQKKLYTAWNKMYPPTKLECERNVLIKKRQGNDNPFVTKACRFKF